MLSTIEIYLFVVMSFAVIILLEALIYGNPSKSEETKNTKGKEGKIRKE